VFGVFFGFLAAFFLDLHSGKDAWIAPMFFVGPFGFMQAAFLGGAVLARFGVMRVTALSTVLTGVAVVGFAWIAPSPYVSAFFFFMYGLLAGVAQTGMTALIYQYSGNRQGAAIFVNSALGPAGSMTGAVLGGVAIIVMPGYDGFKLLILAVAVGMAVTAAAMLMSTRRVGDDALVRE
jgi:predicted MFS family arabinose efflux permease